MPNESLTAGAAFVLGLPSLVGVVIGAGMALFSAWRVDCRKAKREKEDRALRVLEERFIEQRKHIDEFDRLIMKIMHLRLSQEELELLRAEGLILGTRVDFAFNDQQLGKDVSFVMFSTYNAKLRDANAPMDPSFFDKERTARARMLEITKRLRDKLEVFSGVS